MTQVTATEDQSRTLVEQSVPVYGGSRFDLDRGAYLVLAWETGERCHPMTRATAYIPVGHSSCPDGLTLVEGIKTDGHGCHEEMLRQADDMAREQLVEFSNLLAESASVIAGATAAAEPAP